MIAPLPQHPQPPFQGEKPGSKPDPRKAEDGFGGILAAAQAPVRTPPLSGPPPVPEHGPAIVAAPIEPAAEAAMLDPSRAPEMEEAVQAAAEVFNQDGFFGTAIADAAAPEDASPARFAPTGPVEGAAPPPSAGSTLSGISPAIVAGAVTRPEGVPGHRPSSLHAARQASKATAFAAARAASIEVEISGERVKAIVRRAFVREPAARAAVQVVLHELEQGLHIAARPERIRLHDEIAALLASHGLSARSVRIHAPIRSAPLQEKFK